MYAQLLEWKKYHQGVAEQAFRLAGQKIGMLEGDDIAQRITKQYYTNHIEWSYRKDMLESMINILNAFKMIPFSIPDYAEIESGEEATIESAPEPEPTIEEPPLPTLTPPPAIHSPTLKPTNIPRQRIPTSEDVEIARAKAEAKEIERMAQLPKNQTPVRPAPPPKKRFGGGLFKTE
jgi:hypothetical protein